MKAVKNLAFLAVATTTGLAVLCAQGPGGQKKGPAGPGMTLTSPAFPDGGEVPAKYTQADPMGVSPKLEWTNVPQGIQSFVILLHDPDVAIGGNSEDVLHWMAFNIPGDARSLNEGLSTDPMLPDGTVQIKNRRGTPGYMGPGAPAPGPHHHYTFELFGLDSKLSLSPDATREQVMMAMQGHIRAKAVLVGRFHR